MSLFLAPIHQVMYEKIKKQDELNQGLVEKYEIKDLNLEQLPAGQLADIIDTSNIHGWLAGKIDLVESNFAAIVQYLLHEKEIDMGELEAHFEAEGEKNACQAGADQVFQEFTSHFLDGMPCDRVIEPVQVSEDQTSWRQNQDVHGSYWEDGGKTYHRLRSAWISGLAKASNCGYQLKDGLHELKQN